MRKKLNKQKNKTYFIFWEWETEKSYFEALSQEKREKFNIETLIIWKIKSDKIWLGSVESSVFNKIKDKYNFSKKDIKNTNSKIFIILDTDWINWYTKTEIDCIKSFLNKKWIKVLFSNKDFELYILLHLEYCCWPSSDYIREIQKYHNNFDKWYNIELKNVHKKIIQSWFSNVSTNISKLDQHHKKLANKHIKDKIPYSEVYEIFI